MSQARVASLRIGTRGSALALVQAHWVAERLAELGVESEIVEITTAGDRGEGVGDKDRWVSALEAALLEGRIDLAVHSAKDVPAKLADGTRIAGIPARAPAGDVLLGTLRGRVGTASLRRAAQLRALHPEIEVVQLRGNVPTRLAKLDAGLVDGVVLAAAGLHRLGIEREQTALDLVPAPGQGALLIQGKEEIRQLFDPDTSACVAAERALAAALGASCETPMGAHARVVSPGQIELTGWVGLSDGSEWIRDTLVGSQHSVHATLADRMIAVGALDLLARV